MKKNYVKPVTVVVASVTTEIMAGSRTINGVVGDAAQDNQVIADGETFDEDDYWQNPVTAKGWTSVGGGWESWDD